MVTEQKWADEKGEVSWYKVVGNAVIIIKYTPPSYQTNANTKFTSTDSIIIPISKINYIEHKRGLPHYGSECAWPNVSTNLICIYTDEFKQGMLTPISASLLEKFVKDVYSTKESTNEDIVQEVAALKQGVGNFSNSLIRKINEIESVQRVHQIILDKHQTKNTIEERVVESDIALVTHELTEEVPKSS